MMAGAVDAECLWARLDLLDIVDEDDLRSLDVKEGREEDDPDDRDLSL
jgi:hypothetical protein